MFGTTSLQRDSNQEHQQHLSSLQVLPASSQLLLQSQNPLLVLNQQGLQLLKAVGGVPKQSLEFFYKSKVENHFEITSKCRLFPQVALYVKNASSVMLALALLRMSVTS